jgi:hypothetical protein
MGRQRLALLVGPGFPGVLSLKSAARYILSARIPATGKAFVDERLKTARRCASRHGLDLMREVADRAPMQARAWEAASGLPAWCKTYGI